MSGSKPSFFCTRPDGSQTPLIPADELPIGLVIRGLSRVITAGETQGMTSCGVAIHRPENWIIDSYGQSRPSVSTPELLEKLRKIFVEVLKIESAPAQLRQEVSDLLTKGLENVIVAHTAGSKSKALVPARNGPRGALGHQRPQVSSVWLSSRIRILADYS